MRVLAIVVSVVLCTGFAAFSQVPEKPFTLYLGGGLTVPVAPEAGLKDKYNAGYHGLGAVGFKVNPLVQAVFKLEYHTLARDWDADSLPQAEGAALQAVFAGIDARIAPSLPNSPTQPYVFVGLGIAAVSFTDASGLANAVIIPEDESKFYLNIGGGLEIAAGKSLTIFLQGNYLSISSSGESKAFIPVTVGVKF